MISDDAIIRNKKARIAAEQALETILRDFVNSSMHQARFWEIICTEAASKCGKFVIDYPLLDPMGLKEMTEFENVIIPNGSHKGKKVSQVDVSYWTSTRLNEFEKKLARWMRTKCFLGAMNK